tara:strand:- start:4561 stop:4800 length:240 start_codon:yes stop_codon:yes gene_type:complete
MLPLYLLKFLTPKNIKKISQVFDYVFKKNELDNKMDGVIKKVEEIDKDVKKLKKKSHSPKTYIVCDKCSSKIKQYEGTD